MEQQPQSSGKILDPNEGVTLDSPTPVEPESPEKLELENRIAAAEELADDLEDSRTLPDPELNLLTVVALFVSIPVAIAAYRYKMFFVFVIPATVAAVLALFWLIRVWSAKMVGHSRRHTSQALKKLAEEARENGS